jgi:hypothetical protein
MEVMWRNTITFGKMGPPNKIICGAAFLDALAADIRAQVGTNFTVTQPAKGGFVLDGARSRVYFKGVEVEWDPTFETLDALDAPATAWTKRCNFLNNRVLKLKPNKGRWLINRKPPRM